MIFLIAVIQAYDSDRFLTTAVDRGLHVTKIASVGGFLRTGNSTMLMALPRHDVATAMAVVRETCQSRVATNVQAQPEWEYMDWYSEGVAEVTVGGAVMFTVPGCRVYQIWPDTITEVTG